MGKMLQPKHTNVCHISAEPADKPQAKVVNPN